MRGAWVINLLSFVLSVCFHEALVGPKVKAVSLKIVCLALQHVLPSGLTKPPLGCGGGAETRKEVERGGVDGGGTGVEPTSLSHQPLRPRLITDYR